MKERVEHILGNREARNLYIGTFHSVFARILRGEVYRLGYPNSFTIYDTDDAKSVIKTVVQELNLDAQHYKPNAVYNRISAAKNALVGPREYKNDYSQSNAGKLYNLLFLYVDRRICRHRWYMEYSFFASSLQTNGFVHWYGKELQSLYF